MTDETVTVRAAEKDGKTGATNHSHSCPHCGEPGEAKVIPLPWTKNQKTFVVFRCGCEAREEAKRKAAESVRGATAFLTKTLGRFQGQDWATLNPRLSQTHAHDLLARFVDEIATARTPKGGPWGRTARVSGWTADTTPPRVMAIIGGFGTGKTHLVSSAARGLANCGVYVAYMEAHELLRKIRAEVRNGDCETEDELSRVPVLVIDDLGITQMTEWAGETLYGILDHRIRHGLPTAITAETDLTRLPKRLGDEWGGRIVARFAAGCVCAGITEDAGVTAGGGRGEERRGGRDRRGRGAGGAS